MAKIASERAAVVVPFPGEERDHGMTPDRAISLAARCAMRWQPTARGSFGDQPWASIAENVAETGLRALQAMRKYRELRECPELEAETEEARHEAFCETLQLAVAGLALLSRFPELELIDGNPERLV